MVNRRESFLTDLLVLLDSYNADFLYTTDDDGVYFTVDGANPTPGFHGREQLKDWLEALD